MTIKVSAAGRIEALIADLSANRSSVRDAAIAQLTVIGARAVPKLAALARESTALASTRISALRALEGIEDARAIDAALLLFDAAEEEIAIAAIGVAKAGLAGRRGVAAIDRLATVALDTRRVAPVRAAAVQALSGLGFATLGPLLDILAADVQPIMRELAVRLTRGERREPEDAAARVAAAARGVLPDDPETLKRAIGQTGATVPLPDLRQVIDAVRERESSAPSSNRPAWLAVRAAAHLALARRRSRLAVVDLRETLEASSSALPVEFVAALVAVGDASCLEAIAAAWERSGARARRDAWWQRHLSEAFQAIAAREGLTARHTVMKRIEKRWPAAFAALRARPARQ